MVLREAAALMAPPNDVVNENVAALEVLAATRSVEIMVKAGFETAPRTLKLLLLPKLSSSLLSCGTKDTLMSQPSGVDAVVMLTTTVACVELTQVHPDKGADPRSALGATYALQAVTALGKPVPVNVMVLPAYAEAGLTLCRATAPLAVRNESASTAKNKRLGCTRNIPDF